MNLSKLIVLCAIILIPWMGVKDYYTRGEPREALVVQQMVETGNYVLPSVYNEAVPSKPPLFHWLAVGVSTLSGGVNEFATRAPSAFASLLFITCFGIFLKGRQRSRWLAPVILFTSFEWFRASITSRVDMILACCVAGALLALFSWLETSRKKFLFASSILLTAAFLTKGPVGLVLPLGIFAIYWMFESKKAVRPILVCTLLALFASIIPAIWYFLAFKVGGDKFLDKILYENVARFTSTMEDEPHSGSVFYLFGTLIIGLLPWLLVALGGGLSKGFFAGIREKFSRDRFFRFSLFVATGVTFFYSIPDSKRSTYLLPLYPFLAYLLSERIESLSDSNLRVIPITRKILGAVFALLLISILMIVVPIIPSEVSAPFKDYVMRYPMFFALGIILAGIFGYLGLRDRTSPLEAVALLLLSILLLVQSYIAPSVANSLSYKPFSEQIRSIAANRPQIYSFGDEFYGVSFYLKKKFLILNDVRQLEDGDLVVLYEGNLPKLGENLSTNQDLKVLSRSLSDVVKKGKKCLLVEVEKKHE